jgi:ATP-grasp ribosomal peptide maturase
MHNEPTVLILTQPFDITADYVVDELNRRGVPVFRCDPGDFPRDLTLVGELDANWTGSLCQPNREVRLDGIGCAWYRRPTAFQFPDGLTTEEYRWAQHEARRAVGGILGALPRWLNHPWDIARSEYKPVQLQIARAVGLTVPPTLITNDPDAARRFAKEHDQIVYKPLSSTGVSEEGRHKLIYANRLTADDIADTVCATGHLFQRWVDKAYEVRLTVVDETFFAVRIDAESGGGAVDWRTDYHNLRYSVIDVPPRVCEPVLSLLNLLMLRFAALDFVVTPSGEWVFWKPTRMDNSPGCRMPSVCPSPQP